MHHRNSSQIMNILCDLALKFNLNIIRFVKNEINNSKFLMQFFLHHKSNIKFTILCTYFCEILLYFKKSYEFFKKSKIHKF